MLERLRQYRRRAATRVGVALAGVWLAFAAVPCSAVELIGIDLGHQHATQVVVPDAAADHACPHCPPAQPLSASPGDCVGLDDALLTKVAGFDLTLAAPQALPLPAVPSAAAQPSAVVALAPDRPPAVPLNLRYCTFLE